MSDLPTRTEVQPTASFADSWLPRPAEAVPDDGNDTVFELLILTVEDELSRTFGVAVSVDPWRSLVPGAPDIAPELGAKWPPFGITGCCRQMQPFHFQPARLKPGAGKSLIVYGRFWIGALSISQAGEPEQQETNGDNRVHGYSLARRVPNRLSERPPRRRVIDRFQPVKRLIGKASATRHGEC